MIDKSASSKIRPNLRVFYQKTVKIGNYESLIVIPLTQSTLH